MNLQKSLDRILELFGLFQFEVRSYNKAGLFDINTLCEDVFIPILRLLYEAPFLRNLNADRRNFPGLDLGDDQAGIAFQITSDGSLDKIKETLEKVIRHEHYRRYSKIYVYVLTQKQTRYSKKALADITEGYFKFDANKQIIDSSDLIECCRNLSYGVVQISNRPWRFT